MKPIIAITPNFTDDETTLKLNSKYCNAIWKAGGIPIIIDYNINQINSILKIANGLLFTGGGDIDPILMDEEPIKELKDISPIRDNFEIKLCKKAIQLNIPVLGICRGCQILAIASGGDIYQDIYKQSNTNLKHFQQAPKYYPTHTIKIKSNSKLIDIYKKDTILVNSFHHQAVNNLDNNMLISATSNDNIIEAIEHRTNKFAIGVQWHPETMLEKYNEHLELFKQFIKSL